MAGVAARATARAEQQLELRLKWLMFGRLAVAVVGILVALLSRPRDAASVPPYYVLLAACLFNLAYLVAARAGVRLRILAIVQIVLDVVLVGALVYISGIDRLFAIFFFANVIAAAMVLGFRMAVAMASLASILLAIISTVYFLAGHPDYELRLPFVDPELIGTHFSGLRFLLPFLFFFALALHLVALLSGRLTAEVHRVRILNDEILENMAGGVLAADHFGGIQFINSQAARLLGIRDPEGARGRQADAVLPRALAELVQRSLRGEDRVQQEVRLNGSLLGVAISRLLEAGGGPLRGVVVILNDQSLRMQMEEMTRRAERFKVLLEMSAGMAHEIRNPLASIRGAAQELGTSTFAKDEDRQLLQVVIRESDRLDNIISEFLEYASDRPLERGLLDLSELLRETIAVLEARLDRQVEIFREISGPFLVAGEADKLKQVFLNLGLNAIEACSRDVKPGRIVVRCFPSRGPGSQAREGILVEVADDGCGVSGGDLPRVFDPFFTTKPQGTGMGLAIARKIVLAHGGEISMESLPGKGATVRVWLPSS